MSPSADFSLISRLAAPPRPVPLPVRLQALLGGPLNQFGWLFFGFGMVFFWLFACRADVSSWYWFRGRLETAQGRVTASSDAGAAEGGSKHSRGTPIYRNEYSFVVDDKAYHGVSYATGRELQPGRAVTVEYVPGKPAASRIQGMRTNVFGPVVLFVVVFPLVGLGIISFGLACGVRDCRMLANGVPALGNLVSKDSTSVRVNRRMVYKYAFTFKTLDGEICTATTRSSADIFAGDAGEPVLYDPRQPRKAVLLARLTGAPRFHEDGRLVTRPGAALLCSILPLATILGHGWWLSRLLSH